MVEDPRVKEALGEDYEAFLEFKAQKDRRAKQQQSKDVVRAMIAEGGKYFEQYDRLDQQLGAIWEKVQVEARKQVGIEEEE